MSNESKVSMERKLFSIMQDGKWYSNYAIQRMLQSGSGDRAFRRLRENTPTGWQVIDRWKEFGEGVEKVRYKEYSLVRLKKASQLAK